MLKVNRSIFAVVLFAFISWGSEVSSQSAKKSFTEYDNLTAKQIQLIEGWAKSENTTGKAKFDTMTLTQHSTFQAVTNALSRTTLTGQDGRLIGHAIDLVRVLEYPAGQEQGKRSDEQFRLYVKLTADAIDKLEASREFGRGKDNTVFHHGYPINYRQLGKSPTLQFSINSEKDRADIDVDYRSSSFPSALFNGHLTAGNSDVRVGSNYGTHLTRWVGLIDWWDKEVPNVLSEIIGIDTKTSRIKYVPVLANGQYIDASGVESAMDEFLNLWLVKGDPKSSAKFLSGNLAACLDTADKGAEVIFRQRRRVLFYSMMQAANKAVGKVDKVEKGVLAIMPLYSNIVPLDHARKNAYTLAHAPTAYYDHFVCDGTTEDWNATEAEREGTYGKYFVAMFKFNTRDGMGGGLKLFWIRESDNWKIITFDVVGS